jgi:hypothetical protein
MTRILPLDFEKLVLNRAFLKLVKHAKVSKITHAKVVEKSAESSLDAHKI